MALHLNTRLRFISLLLQPTLSILYQQNSTRKTVSRDQLFKFYSDSSSDHKEEKAVSLEEAKQGTDKTIASSKRDRKPKLKQFAVIAAGGVGLTLGIQLALNALGFARRGIVAGTPAASMHGATQGTGFFKVFSTVQSVGSSGLSASQMLLITFVGSAATYAASKKYNSWRKTRGAHCNKAQSKNEREKLEKSGK